MKSINVYIGSKPDVNGRVHAYGAKAYDNQNVTTYSGVCECRPESGYPVLKGLYKTVAALDEPAVITLYTDNGYVRDSIRFNRIRKWQANNWIQANGKKASYAKTWQRLLDLADKCGHKIYAIANINSADKALIADAAGLANQLICIVQDHLPEQDAYDEDGLD